MADEIIHGDCVAVLPRFKGQVDLIVTSPPYDGLRQYDGKSMFDFEGVASACVDALKVKGVLCWNVQDQQIEGDFTLTSFRHALRFQELGLKCREKLIYERAHPQIRSHQGYLRSYEHVFVFSKGIDSTFNPLMDRGNLVAGRTRPTDAGTGRTGDAKAQRRDRGFKVAPHGRRTDIWRYPSGLYHTAPDMPEAHDVHPAMMPLKLAQDLIRSYSNEGDLVLDPFVGSGTTAVAAKYLLRDCVGIDINAEYCEFARSRIAQDVLL